MEIHVNYCKYYQADVAKEDVWFFVATLRENEHLCFDRTLDKTKSIFEFFVPSGYEREFLKIMKYYKNSNIIKNLKKLPNRLRNEDF